MRFLATLLASTLGLAILGSPALADDVRGITVSTHTDGREYGGPAMPPTFEQLRELGANWVAIHPYASIRADGGVRVWNVSGEDDPSAYVRRTIEQAHAAGLKILVKPHLAYWGSRFTWRGEIEFSSERHWGRFWREYDAWVVDLARASARADAFAVGTELDRTLHDEAAWRRIIARVRAATPAPLTYAANWTDYRRVPFWDALDAIGIQAYFPVADRDAPEASEVAAGWRKLRTELESFAADKDMTIVLTELGYGRSFAAAVRPWSYDDDGPKAESFQTTCLEIALDAISDSSAIVGAFLWKWFPEPRPVGRNFQLATPAARAAIRRAWQAPG